MFFPSAGCNLYPEARVISPTNQNTEISDRMELERWSTVTITRSMGLLTPQKDVAIFPPGTGRRDRQQIGVQSPDIVLVGWHPLRSLHSAR